MKRVAFLMRATTWWLIGAVCHAMWLLTLCFGLALVAPLADLIRAHHPELPGSAPEAAAGNLLIQGIFIMFATGVLALGIAGVLQWRENRVASRIKRGLCAKCGYDLRGGSGAATESPTCPECGTRLPSPSR
jgi:hypothetical protein